MTDEMLFHLWLIGETTNRSMDDLIAAWNAGRLWVDGIGYNYSDEHRAVFDGKYCGEHGTFHTKASN